MASAKEDISDNFFDIARKIPFEKWISIGRSLGLDDKAIDNVKVNYKDDDPEEKIYQMLRSWREKFPEQCTLQVLVSALNTLEMNDTARKIQEMFQGRGNVFKKNPISALNELCQKKNWKNPKFEEWDVKSDKTKFLSKVSVNGIEFGPKVASCIVKKDAKTQAALVALYALYNLDVFPENFISPDTIDGFYTNINYQQAMGNKGPEVSL